MLSLFFKFRYFTYFLHVLCFTKFVLSFICSAKCKMVIIGKKQNKKSRNRLPQKRRRQWNVREKLMVVNFFENNGNVCGMAKKFNIEPKQVRDWIKKKEKMLEMVSYVAKIHPGKLPKYPNLENNLFLWITEKRANGNAVTRKLITRKAVALSKDWEFMLNNPSIAGFKFSSK